MATKKGIVLTAVSLGAITAASFLIWIIPQQNSTNFVISDYNAEMNSIKERHQTIIKEIDTELQNMASGSLSPDDFISRAQISSSQINSLLSEIIESKAPQEWRESYFSYGESLKKYDEYLTETIVIANKMKEGVSPKDLSSEFQQLSDLKKESETLATKSVETKP